VSLLKREPIELVGREEDTVVEDAVDLEVGFGLDVVERVIRLPHLL